MLYLGDMISAWKDRNGDGRLYRVLIKGITLMDRKDQVPSTDREVAPIPRPVGILDLHEGANDKVLRNHDSWEIGGEVALQC